LKEENTKLEGMAESRDELITEISKEIRLDRTTEEVEAEDDDDGGDVPTPSVAVMPPPAPTPPAAAVPEEIIMEEDPVEMVPEQEALVVHGVILVDAKLELPQPRLYRMLMRDYGEI
jgi:hypothetical protein